MAYVVSDKELVLLALVSEEPIHAYGLEEKIRARQMTDWTAISFSSIYRVLKGLEDEGLVRSRLVHEGQGATRKVHELTEAGREALAEAVLDRLGRAQDVKSPFFMAVYAITAAPRDRVHGRLAERLAYLDSLEHCMAAQEGAARVGLQEALADLPEDERGRTAESAGLRIELLFDLARRYRAAERDFLQYAMARIQGVAPDRFEKGARPAN